MASSKLVSKVFSNLSGHAARSGGIDHIIIHHMAGNLSLDTCYSVLKRSGSSANYLIDSNGKIGLALDERFEPYTTSNRYIDDRAVTIEVANSSGAPSWKISDKALNALIELCADICKRNNIKSLSFTGDTRGNLEAHRYYAATACPGDYLLGKFPEIASRVNAKLGSNTSQPNRPSTPTLKTDSQIAQEVIRGLWGNGEDRKNRLTRAGYNASNIQKKVNEIIYGKTVTSKKSNDVIANEVIAGKWGNGEDRKNRLTRAGYHYQTIQNLVNKKLK